MSHIHLDGVGHSYAGTIYALEKANIRFEDGKTYALLGPSGCGKTTMLNVISGLLYPSDGRVLLGDTDVTRVPTAKRNIAQVFQFPVVYQSKSVFGNLAFPLVCRNWEQGKIKFRVGNIAELLGLSAKLGQSARRLTADEKQLISLGRGLVRDDVAALLMDEPLTVIDPQMKFELRRKIKSANSQTRQTVVYVTHDQNEAMTFADEVLVMKAGRVVQRGTPEDLFENPADTYVGNFIGSPGMNFLDAEPVTGGIAVAGTKVLGTTEFKHAGKVQLGIRPEYVSFARNRKSGIAAQLTHISDLGNVRIVDLALGKNRIKMKVRRGEPIPSSGDVRIDLPAAKLRVFVDGVSA